MSTHTDIVTTRRYSKPLKEQEIIKLNNKFIRDITIMAKEDLHQVSIKQPISSRNTAQKISQISKFIRN